ncbi:MerR family transcriptional regulator [Arachnia propionica]|uniref:MerR family transcriptional regulator n=1 Tax=Arachnia propionica TaxID=1750 RepID=A0A3P1T145_9ACTN|nr:MerR family transcriptional regulator [Arachnia propionica]RRD03217.1 MerR family transcriptional regulator [Arachnia propionica]
MTHTVDVEQALGELPELCALLPDALTSGPDPWGGGRTGASSGTPLRLDVLQLLDTRDTTGWLDGMEFCDPDGVGVLPFLWGWCRDLASDLFDTCPGEVKELPEQPTLTAVTDWLTQHLPLIRGTAQWPEFEWGVLRVHRQVRAAVRHLKEPSPAVPCPRCGTGPLEAPAPDEPLWVCRPCGHEVTIQAVTLRQASRLVDVPERTLRDWASRPGLLSPVAEGPRRRLFDLGQIRRLAAERKLRAML